MCSCSRFVVVLDEDLNTNTLTCRLSGHLDCTLYYEQPKSMLIYCTFSVVGEEK